MVTLRKKIAQMLIIGFDGTTIENTSPIALSLNEGLGGVILFDYDLPKKKQGKNLINQTQIKQLNQQIRHYSSDNPLPPFIAIDYEGGVVDRLRHIEGCLPTISPKHYATLPQLARLNEAKKMANTLVELGFNLNFSPVVDLNLNESAGIIGKLERSYSSHPETMARLAQEFVRVFFEAGIACCYKHFPGHGSAEGDTHNGFVDVTDTFKLEELAPYSLVLNNKELPSMVMTAHVINRHLDSQNIPATLSYPILTGILREQMGFDGVVISDDLQMHAISNHYNLEEALQKTINAGADMVIVGNQLGEASPNEVIDIIENLVHSNLITQKRIDESYLRISSLKRQVFM